MSDHHPLYDSCYPCSLSWGTFFCFSFVQVMSHRDDVLALCFYCELAREEKYEAMASKTEVLTRTKGVSWFCLTRFVRLPLRSRCFYLPALAVGVTTGKQLAIPSAFVFRKTFPWFPCFPCDFFSAQSAPICVLCVSSYRQFVFRKNFRDFRAFRVTFFCAICESRSDIQSSIGTSHKSQISNFKSQI